MNKIIAMGLFASLLIGCSTNKKNSDFSSGNSDSLTPRLSPPETADVKFVRNGKELAQLVIEDSDSGVNLTFSSTKLEKGNYVLLVEDACKAPARAKNELPKKMQKLELGDLSVVSRDTSLEFSKPGLSIADRFIDISEKSVTLNKKNKKGILSRISCAKMIKR